MSFLTISCEYSAFYEIKKSTFYAHLAPSKDFDNIKDRLKSEHPKARHIVWAKRELNEFDQVVENSSDDGEPKGTSGPPVLNVLRGSNLINVAVLIVRYFGGIKLGTGGLVRAYSSSCNEAINVATLEVFEKKRSFCIEVIYSSIQFVEYKLNSLKIAIEDKQYGTNGALFKVVVSENQEVEFLKLIESLKYEGVSFS